MPGRLGSAWAGKRARPRSHKSRPVSMSPVRMRHQLFGDYQGCHLAIFVTPAGTPHRPRADASSSGLEDRCRVCKLRQHCRRSMMYGVFGSNRERKRDGARRVSSGARRSASCFVTRQLLYARCKAKRAKNCMHRSATARVWRGAVRWAAAASTLRVRQGFRSLERLKISQILDVVSCCHIRATRAWPNGGDTDRTLRSSEEARMKALAPIVAAALIAAFGWQPTLSLASERGKR